MTRHRHTVSQKLIHMINTLRPRQNGRHFTDNISKCIFIYENVWIPIKISMKFVPKGPINNIPALVPIMAWHWPGDKPLSEPMMVRLLTYICVTRPQRVKLCSPSDLLLRAIGQNSGGSYCSDLSLPSNLYCCSNYIFILNLTPGFNGKGKDNSKTRWETFKLWDLVHLTLEIWC